MTILTEGQLQRSANAAGDKKRGGGGGGGRTNVLIYLQLVQIFLDSLNQANDAANLGYHHDFRGIMIIDDPDKAAQNLGNGFTLQLYPGQLFAGEPYLFTVENGRWVTHDWRCNGCTLYRDDQGRVRMGLMSRLIPERRSGDKNRAEENL